MIDVNTPQPSILAWIVTIYCVVWAVDLPTLLSVGLFQPCNHIWIVVRASTISGFCNPDINSYFGGDVKLDNHAIMLCIEVEEEQDHDQTLQLKQQT